MRVWVNKANIRRASSQEEEQRGRTRDKKQRRRQELGSDVAWYHRDTETSQLSSTAAAEEGVEEEGEAQN